MKIQLEQLIPQLTKKLAPLYLVSGDEFLLVQEACDSIRHHTAAAGYREREVFHIEPGFNWEQFLTSVNNASLFSERLLIELHIKHKLAETPNKILQNYAAHPAPDKIILIVTNKLDATQQKAGWVKAIDAQGILLQIWPIELANLPAWISRRLRASGLNAEPSGLQLLADHVAGNLLAAAQEIEKLGLLYGKGNLTLEQISAAITDNARFNIFNLLDAALTNQPTTIIRIIANLKHENVDPTLILWVITNELRSLINISSALQQGVPIEQALTQNHIWSQRKPLVKKILLQYKLPHLQAFLKSAASIDLIIKGANSQNLVWHELSNLYLNFADQKLSASFIAPH